MSSSDLCVLVPEPGPDAGPGSVASGLRRTIRSKHTIPPPVPGSPKRRNLVPSSGSGNTDLSPSHYGNSSISDDVNQQFFAFTQSRTRLAAVVPMKTGVPAIVGPAEVRDSQDLLVARGQYDYIKVMGLITEARRLSFRKRNTIMRECRIRLQEEMELSGMQCPHSHCPGICTCPPGLAFASRAYEESVRRVAGEAVYWKNLTQQARQELLNGVPGSDIICYLSVQKIFLR